MSYHCDYCGKLIKQSKNPDDELIPEPVDAQVGNDDGTWCTVDNPDSGRSFTFKIAAADAEVAEHYHRICSLAMLEMAVRKAIEHLEVDGEVAP